MITDEDGLAAARKKVIDALEMGRDYICEAITDHEVMYGEHWDKSGRELHEYHLAETDKALSLMHGNSKIIDD